VRPSASVNVVLTVAAPSIMVLVHESANRWRGARSEMHNGLRCPTQHSMKLSPALSTVALEIITLTTSDFAET